MNIVSNFDNDVRSTKKSRGSYEWWYFDATSENGYQIVVIFYEGNPFSRRYIQKLDGPVDVTAAEFPALSISVYKNGEAIYYSFRETDKENALFSERIPKGKIGDSYFEGSRIDGSIRYRVVLNQKLDNGDSIQADLIFSSTDWRPEGFSETGDMDAAQHSWNLVMPNCEVQGNVGLGGLEPEQIDFKGSGYHDHNIGSEPMKESFYEWYWGRYHIGETTFIYYLMNRFGEWEKRAWLIDRNRLTLVCNEIQMQGQILSVFGLNTARILKFTFPEKELFLQLDQVMDNGPFYQRYLGRLLLGSGSDVESVRGISEYIRPARIYSRIFWPLVDMRIRYPGKAHWVQKNPRLYRWTW